MRKFLSYRNISSFLFIATFLIFVMAQRYTTEKGPKVQSSQDGALLLNKTPSAFSEYKPAKDSSIIAVQ